MRIDAYNKINELYRTTNNKNIKAGNKSDKKDSLEISKGGQNFNFVKQVINSTPDVREDKVANLKEAISSGTYNVSDDALVEHILDKGFDQSI